MLEEDVSNAMAGEEVNNRANNKRDNDYKDDWTYNWPPRIRYCLFAYAHKTIQLLTIILKFWTKCEIISNTADFEAGQLVKQGQPASTNNNYDRINVRIKSPLSPTIVSAISDHHSTNIIHSTYNIHTVGRPSSWWMIRVTDGLYFRKILIWMKSVLLLIGHL